MPIQRYSVLKGKPSKTALDDDSDPHVEIRIEAAGVSHRIAVNIRSGEPPYGLLYKVIKGWSDPRIAILKGLPEGRHRVAGHPGLAFDYARDGVLTPQTMDVAPYDPAHPSNDLRQTLMPVIDRAIAEGDIVVYAFGETWENEQKEDGYFHFTPGNGIHDIHMNQGSGGRFAQYNGVHQDGALILHDLSSDEWTAIFMAFQGQTWDTDDATGHPKGTGAGSQGGRPGHADTQSRRNGSIKIVAALVNPKGAEEGNETVTLLNLSDVAIGLEGMSLVDDDGRVDALSGKIEAGEALRVRLSGSAARLANKSGTLSLRSANGSTIDSIRYAKSDLGPEGWTVPFR